MQNRCTTGRTYLNNVKGVKRMNSAHASSTKELNSKAVDAAVLTIISTELTPTVSENPPSFEPDNLFKKHVAFGPPNMQRVILTQR